MNTQTQNFNRPKRPPPPTVYSDPLWERVLYGIVGFTLVSVLWGFLIFFAVYLINQGY